MIKFHLPTCFTADAQFAAVKVQVNDETGELQTQADQLIEAIIEMDWGSDKESCSQTIKSKASLLQLRRRYQ